MDTSAFGSYAGIASLILFCLREGYNLINHTRLRSSCCGKQIEASIDIEKGSPK
jgi:hypothetical protein